LPIQYGDPKPRKKLSEYKIDFANFIERVWELDIPFINLYFPNFLINPEKTCTRLINFGLHELNLKPLTDLIDGNLIHGRT
jgi:hypothetical protein